MSKQFEQKDRLFAQITVTAHLCGVSVDTIETWIESGKLVERVHFVRPSDRMRLFNVELLRDRIANWDDDSTHSKAIYAFQAGLLSSQQLSKRKAS